MKADSDLLDSPTGYRGLLTYRIGVREITLFLWVFMLVLSCSFFDLVSYNGELVAGLRTKDFYFAFSAGFLLLVAVLLAKKKGFFQFSSLLGGWLLVVACGSLAAFLHFGQSIALSILAQRDILAGICNIFSFGLLYSKGVLDSASMLKWFKRVALILLILDAICWVNYSTAGTLLLPGATIINDRYDSARLFFTHSDYISVLCFLALNDLLKDSKAIAKNTAVVILCVVYFLVFSQLRAAFTALMFAICLAFLLWRKPFFAKTVVLVIVGILAVYELSQLDLVQDLIQLATTGTTFSKDTLSIRDAAAEYYLGRFLESPILGWGFPHEQNPAAFYAQGQALGYYFSDNGFISFMYFYGVIGICWFAYFVFVMTRTAFRCYTKSGNYVPLLWLACEAGMLRTGMFWAIANQQIGLLVVMIVAMECSRNKGNDLRCCDGFAETKLR